MAILKCKMCGGDLEIKENSTVCECEYCGTIQTIPVLDNEKKANLFNRANRLRTASEFDKASGVYESIVAEFPEEAEAYWGLCLCKYGIEYVDDPATGNKIPTCHRTSYGSIFDDSNYEMAQQHSDISAQRIYQEEAQEIDRIQRSILDIAQKEAPYDVFICYKETAEEGQRTKDSVLAQDIYDALTAKGYKVFFARITLEDKLGQEYEPYIFSALHSAKVMLAIGTKHEYYTAVWVKNEWSRFLDMMKNNKEKVLIPCYADIDAYDMPQEFKNLQGQDMGKVGFLQDLVRGIGKIIPIKSDADTKAVNVSAGGGPNIKALLQRAAMALEDGDFIKVNEFCEQALNQDAENAEAYLYKLMGELGVRSRSALKSYKIPFDNKNTYKKAYNFGDESLKEELTECNTLIKERIEKERIEKVYSEAMGLFTNVRTEDAFKKAKELFLSINTYKDSAINAEKCDELKEEGIYNDAVYMQKAADSEEKYKKAAKHFESISGYKDADEQVKKCLEQAEYSRKLAILNKARGFRHDAPFGRKEYTADSAKAEIEDFKQALKLLSTISGFEDADELVKEYQHKIEYNTAIARSLEGSTSSNAPKGSKQPNKNEKLTKYQEEERKKQVREKIKKQNKFWDTVERIQKIIIIAIIAVIVGFFVLKIPVIRYGAGKILSVIGINRGAADLLSDISEYKDAQSIINNCSMKALKRGQVKPGDVIGFGKYCWVVLETNDTSAVIVTTENVEYRKYNETKEAVSWENCSLRTYLNGEFLNNFSEAEKALIADTKVINSYDNDKDSDKAVGNDTIDKVFILSADETKMNYYGYQEKYLKKSPSWWTRSIGEINDTANTLNYVALFGLQGAKMDVTSKMGVQPVMTIQFK